MPTSRDSRYEYLPNIKLLNYEFRHTGSFENGLWNWYTLEDCSQDLIPHIGMRLKQKHDEDRDGVILPECRWLCEISLFGKEHDYVDNYGSLEDLGPKLESKIKHMVHDFRKMAVDLELSLSGRKRPKIYPPAMF